MQHITVLIDHIIDYKMSQQSFTLCDFGTMSQSAARSSTETDATTDISGFAQ